MCYIFLGRVSPRVLHSVLRSCACFRRVLHVYRSSARFIEIVHVSQELLTFHKPPTNLCVRLLRTGLETETLRNLKDTIPIFPHVSYVKYSVVYIIFCCMCKLYTYIRSVQTVLFSYDRGTIPFLLTSSCF